MPRPKQPATNPLEPVSTADLLEELSRRYPYGFAAGWAAPMPPPDPDLVFDAWLDGDSGVLAHTLAFMCEKLHDEMGN